MIMKKLMNYFCVLLFLLATHGLVHAQDFTVKIESTDASNHYFEPLKAGGSRQFQIMVKNNTSDTCTVSIDKDDMGYVSSWVSIEDNEQELFPSQSKNFLLTITIPSNATEGIYEMFLYFNAYAKNSSHNNSFEYFTQLIIVDNSPPDAPTFSIGQKTSTTLSITSWSSWDQFSNKYSFQTGSADKGIKEYKIYIETQQGSVVNSIIKQPSDATNHTFKYLTPNTIYKACVTATDLVGYSTTTKKSVTMPPAKPTGLAFSNITYIDVTLSWSTSAGATGYDVYKVVGNTNTKLNNSPITGNSYSISGLNPNSTYTFNVIALSNVGPSDRSNNASVTTLALPPITGSSTICSGAYTYTIPGLVYGYTISWSHSPNLHKQSSTGSTANFIKTSNGSGWIGASITAPNQRVLELTKKNVWVGTPKIDYFEYNNDLCLLPYVIWHLYPESNVTYHKLECNGITLESNNGVYNIYADPVIFNIPRGQAKPVFVYAGNVCGTELLNISSLYRPTYADCGDEIISPFDVGNKLIIFPNPANDYIEAYLENLTEEELLDNEKLHIKIINSNSIPVYNGTTQQKRFQINTSSFSEGVYYLLVQYKNQKYSTIILISR